MVKVAAPFAPVVAVKPERLPPPGVSAMLAVTVLLFWLTGFPLASSI